MGYKWVIGNNQHGIIFSIFFVHYQRLTVDFQMSADPMVRFQMDPQARWCYFVENPNRNWMMTGVWGSMGSLF